MRKKWVTINEIKWWELMLIILFICGVIIGVAWVWLKINPTYSLFSGWRWDI